MDSASGTEAAPGRKDPERLRAFVEAVAAAGGPSPESHHAPPGPPRIGQAA